MSIEQLKTQHDKLQEGLPSNMMAIRDCIIINVGEGAYDSYPRFGFQFFCFRSPEMVSEFNCFIEHAKGKKCLLDIGAFHGLFSLVFAEINKDSKVYSFEPSEAPFEMLSKLIEPYPNIFKSNYALSDTKEIIDMYHEWGHLVIGNKQITVKVPTTTGDNYCTAERIAPDCIKIDVEGMELRVLRGLTKVITENHPIIFLELHNTRLNEKDLNDICDILGQWNYKPLDTKTNNPMSYGQIKSIKNEDLRLVLL